jgi:threonyl-tRNA synthetase
MDMSNTNYRPLWLKGGIAYAKALESSGYHPVEVGLGERDFYVDVQSNSSITMAEAEKVIEKVKYDNLNYNFKVNSEGISPSNENPSFFKVLNISVHHPNPTVQLVRIRGVAFTSEEQLKDYLSWLDKVSEIDHRILGEKLDLFSFHEESGPGLVLYHPKGQIIRNELMNFMREINASMGYSEVYTTHVYRSELWKISGHYELYKDKMLIFNHDEDELGLKPMNCPAHILIYKSRSRSYRELPIKLSEFGHVYRWENKGELYGLLRVRGFVQDDGHIFLIEEQLEDEVKLLVSKTLEVLSKFGFGKESVKIYLSTRPDESIGTDQQWEKATSSLENALKSLGQPYQVKEKEGAFYGPKLDFEIKDSLGRSWQLSTIQVDFNLPERFKLEYVDHNGEKRRPVMVHRAIFGSIDRFMAILLENFRGKMPTWISPTQVRVIPITLEVNGYARTVMTSFRERGIRVDLDDSPETLSKRIKEAYDEGIPYIVIVGKREATESKVTLRGRNNVEIRGLPLDLTVNQIKGEVERRDVNQTAIERLKK